MTALETPGQIETPPAAPQELYEAMLAVKREIPTLRKDKSATVATSKGTYTYTYTGLDTLAEAVNPTLDKHGLVWTTLPGGTKEFPTLSYQLMHAASGQWIGGVMPLMIERDGSQGHGSAITYARRYALQCVLDLVADEDDDGQAASTGYHRESRASSDGQDMRDRAKGLTDTAINAARQTVGLPKLDKPWGSLVNVPAEKAEAFATALDDARAAS